MHINGMELQFLASGQAIVLSFLWNSDLYTELTNLNKLNPALTNG